MSEWQAYELTYVSLGPLQIGWHNLGLIQRTRTYVPARALWGACAAGLATAKDAREGIQEAYQNAQQEVDSHVRFSYLYRAADGEVLRPRYEAEGLKYGTRMSAVQFEGSFVRSQASAALLPETLTAEEGALHESEYLTEGDEKGHPAEYVGYLFLNKPELKASLDRVLADVRVGSDRKYGWGALRLREGLEKVGRVFGEFEFDGSEGPKLIARTKTCHIAAHLASWADRDELKGDLEIFRGREWSEAGPGRKFSESTATSRAAIEVCWVPGSKCRGRTFEVGRRGTWS